MKKRVSKTDKVVEQILEGLEDGKTLTSICEGENMPTIRAVQKWCRADAELDEKILRAWIRGLRIRHDHNADKQAAILDNPAQYDPKVVNAMATVMRDINHNIMAMLTRLDKRFSDKQQVENIGGPMIIGWASEMGDETKADDIQTVPRVEPHGGDVRQH